ncbi:MAG: hypothetical protein AB7O45_05120 [Alphaproteobacteria bacterium]
MKGEGKAELARIAALQASHADLERRVSALETSIGRGGAPGLSLPVAAPVYPPVHPALAFGWPGAGRLLGGGLFALGRLPRTMAWGDGKSPCQGATSAKTVYTFTEGEWVVCVVEATDACRCASLQMRLVRVGAIVAQSPVVEPGNTASFGPVAARANDTLVVDCSGEGFGQDQCQYNWQVNRAS